MCIISSKVKKLFCEELAEIGLAMNRAAENQHYVPKFILRKFLTDIKKEQVSVFQKSTGRVFTPNINGIMSERRFNEFRINEDYYTSFESDVCRIEDIVLPTYEALAERQQITGSAEEAELLGVFVAFQMLRVRAYRDWIADTSTHLHDQLAQKGFDPSDIGELIQTEDELKESHLSAIRSSIQEFSLAIAEKDFILLKAPPDRHFYLGDNPVTLHNDEPQDGIWSNIGLSVKGIQIYVPLTSKLMLAAWCPSLLGHIKDQVTEKTAVARRLKAQVTLGGVMFEPTKRAEFDGEMAKLESQVAEIAKFASAAESGEPLLLSSKNMDHYNALQVQSAKEFIICQHADFDLARRVVAKEGPKSNRTIQVG